MSKTKLRSATFSINQLISQMKIASYASQYDTKVMLIRCIKDLHLLGFKVGHVKGIKGKQIEALINHWKSQEKKPETIKNYLAKLRKMARFLGTPEILKPINSCYQIEGRKLHTSNRALHHMNFPHCKDPYIRLSLEGQSLFGLRREESLKIIIHEADAGKYLSLKPSWTKGGIGRIVPIHTQEQRDWINKVKSLVRFNDSLIPPGQSYHSHLSRYKHELKQMGIHHAHGLRHAYAQKRYHELTAYFDSHKKGLIAPIAGGKSFKELSDKEKDWDRSARHIIARELGHSRINITKIYCG